MPHLEHVGIAVEDVSRVLETISSLIGEPRYAVEAVETDAVRTHFLWGGSAKLELLEAAGDASPIRAFLDRRGSGIHHLAFEVDDIHGKFAAVSKAGFRPLDAAPRRGADGKMIFFLHPKDTGGVLIEFCQRDRPAAVPVDVDVPGVRRVLRTAGSAARPAALYLCADAGGDDVEQTAARCEPARAFFAVECEASVDMMRVAEALDLIAAHVVAVRPMIDAALEASTQPWARSIILLDPPGGTAPLLRNLRPPALAVLDGDEAGLHAAGVLRRAAPGLAMVAAGGPLRTAIIATQMETADS